MHLVYILYSQRSGRYYIGHTKNITKRLGSHNAGKVKSTKAYKPWTVVHLETAVTKQSAFKREQEIKAYKGGNAFKKLIKQ